MDKNMINIDDLLRQRLGDGEEKERPGAWLQMRDLLDQKMPVQQQPGSAFNWRRMLGVITGVVAISAVGLGGYQAVTSFRNNGDITKDATASTGNTSTGSGRLARIAANSEQQFSGKVSAPANAATTMTGGTTGSNQSPAKASNTIAASDKATENTASPATGTTAKTSKTNNHAVGTATTAGDNNNIDNNTGTAVAVENKNDNPLISNEKNQSDRIYASTAGTIDKNVKSVPVANRSTETTSNATETSNPSGNRKTPRIVKNNKANKGTVADNSTVNSGTVVSTPTVTAAKTNKAVNSNKPKAGKVSTVTNNATSLAKAKTPGNTKTNTGTKPVAQVTTNNSTGTNDNAGQDNNKNNNKYVVTKESIAKIETRETYTKEGKLKIDTISVGTFERDKMVLASAADDKTSLGAQIASPADNLVVPASDATAAKDDFKGEVAPASKVRRKKEPLWTPKKLEEMVRNTRLNMNDIRFYPGIIAGANTLLGKGDTRMGFQLGLSGNLSFNDRWCLFTEAKYVHRFAGATMDVRESGAIQQVVQNNQTTYLYTPTLHKYAVKDIKAIEVPVALRYTFDRISLFLGANYAYYFAMTAEDNPTTLASVTSTTEPQVSGSKISRLDFGSRYGIGYMIGGGYNLAPNKSLDIRLSRPMFSSVNTAGSKEVSQKIFTVPSIQVSFNYYFISPKKVR